MVFAKMLMQVRNPTAHIAMSLWRQRETGIQGGTEGGGGAGRVRKERERERGKIG